MTDEDEIDYKVMFWIVENERPDEIEISTRDKYDLITLYLSGPRRVALEDETGLEPSEIESSLKRLWVRFRKDLINEEFKEYV